MTNKFINRIQNALDLACPKKTFRIKCTGNKWFGEDLNDLRNEVAKDHNSFYKSKTDWHRQEYKRSRNKYKYACRKAKKRSWDDFVDSTETPKQVSKYIGILSGQSRATLGALKKTDGTYTTPGEETAKMLLNTHFPSNSARKNIFYDLSKRVVSSELAGLTKEWITIDKVKTALTGFNKKKSPGPDGIKPIVFDHMPPNAWEALTVIYQACIVLQFTPKAWKETKVIFIPKPGKSDYTNPKAFRPISLSNYLLKALERLCCWRMETALELNPIHDKQNGFRSDRSTETAISSMTSYVENYLFKRQQAVGVFLDISAAFDSIHTDFIKKQLLSKGADPLMVAWYINYITDRHLNFNVTGHEGWLSTGVGFPQGGVCSGCLLYTSPSPRDS